MGTSDGSRDDAEGGFRSIVRKMLDKTVTQADWDAMQRELEDRRQYWRASPPSRPAAEVVEAVCRLPITFRAGTKSMTELVFESGLVAARDTLTREGIEAHLTRNPDAIENWFGYSEDQRCSPCWWVARVGQDRYQVGLSGEPDTRPPMDFSTRIGACVEYVYREAMAIADIVDATIARRAGHIAER
jgi:hypothetical protein